ncbi:hypothetical protein BH23GEM2_BH23GEM2_14850 [soil metagenome]
MAQLDLSLARVLDLRKRILASMTAAERAEYARLKAAK